MHETTCRHLLCTSLKDLTKQPWHHAPCTMRSHRASSWLQSVQSPRSVLFMTISIYFLASSVLVLCCAVLPASVIAFSSSAPVIVPEVHPAHVTKVTQHVKAALGDEDGANDNRYAFARDAVTSFQENDESPPSKNLCVWRSYQEYWMQLAFNGMTHNNPTDRNLPTIFSTLY